MLDISAYLLIVTISAYLLLGFFVLIYGQDLHKNRLMFGMSFSAILWAYSVMMVVISSDNPGILIWARVSFAAAIIIPWHVYALALSFRESKPTGEKRKNTLLLLTILVALSCLSPFMVESIQEPLKMKVPGFGIAAYPYYAYFIFIFFLSVSELYRSLSDSSGLERIQVRYFMSGTLIAYLLSFMSNGVLPLLGVTMLGSLDLRALGPAFSLILVGSVSIAIIRYRFMDVRFAFRRNAATLLTAGALALALFLFSRAVVRWELMPPDFNLEAAFAVAAVPALVLYTPVRKRVQHIVDRHFFASTVDYRITLLEKTKTMLSLIDQDELLRYLTKSIVEDMDLERGYYYRGGRLYEQGLFEITGRKELPGREFNYPSRLIEHMEKKAKILTRAELKKTHPSSTCYPVEREMEELKIELVVPLFAEYALEGILFLGPKYSGEPFYLEDLQLMSILSSQITAAMKNAGLYRDLSLVKNYLEMVLENMGNGLIAINEKEMVTIFNSEAEAITGIRGKNALGRRADEVLDSSLYELCKKTLINGHGLDDVEIVVQGERGEQFISCNTSIFNSSFGPFSEVIVVLSNVTRIKELEKEKNHVQRLASLGEISAAIAHEIKNPLVAIKTFAELLPDQFDDFDFRHSFSKVVSQEICRINDLVSQLLDFVRDTDLNLTPVRLNVLLDDIILLLSSQLEKQEISVCKKYDHNLPSIDVDQRLIRQALMNIFINAIQAMPHGGVIRVGVTWEKGRAKIDIEDTGTGIAEAVREKIFEPFVTSKAEGVGLGLSISHKIIHAHGGRIRFSSRENTGTNFEITVPG